MIPANAVKSVIDLLLVLDPLFELGGKLVEEAMKKAPELNAAPVPDLGEMDAARADALKRVGDT